MNDFESARHCNASLGWGRLSREIDLLANPQRDPANSYRAERSYLFSSGFGAAGLSNRGLLTATFYRKYIQSSAWRDSAARLGELEASGNRCRLCDAPSSAEDPLQVHHRTYARLGCELQRDLTALCADCHRGVTSMLRERRYETTAPIGADVVLSGLRQRLLDPTREEAER